MMLISSTCWLRLDAKAKINDNASAFIQLQGQHPIGVVKVTVGVL